MAGKKSTANTHKTNGKKNAGRIENLKPWPKGVSGNPKGRPPDGESWAGVLRWAAELTGEEAAAFSPPEMAREFRKLGNLKLKQAVTLRTFAAMLFEPSSGLFNAMMDRAEGKVPDKLEIADWREEAKEYGIDPDKEVSSFEQALTTGKTDAG